VQGFEISGSALGGKPLAGRFALGSGIVCNIIVGSPAP